MRDRRYSTVRWQRLSRFVRARDQTRQVQGPRCNGLAQTAHHKLPSSQYPELFWDPENLEASCLPCNQHGAVVKAENRANRQTIAHPEAVIEQQAHMIEELLAELAARGDSVRQPARAAPRIY